VGEDDSLALSARSTRPEDDGGAQRCLGADIFGRGEGCWLRREEDLPVLHLPASNRNIGRGRQRSSRSSIVVVLEVDEEDVALGRVAELLLQRGGEESEGGLEVGETGGRGDEDAGLGEGEDVGDFGRSEDGVGGRELGKGEIRRMNAGG